MSVESIFLNYAATKLDNLSERIGVCMAKLTPEQIWMRTGENQNAIGNLALHLNGNLRQWIITGVGGEPTTRDRDAEFAARGGVDPAEIISSLQETVRRSTAIIRALPPERLAERLVIQGHEVNALEAIFHVVEHFSGHAAQIMFITKMLTGEDLGFYSYLSKPGAAKSQTP